jgi:hypothetical protein
MVRGALSKALCCVGVTAISGLALSCLCSFAASTHVAPLISRVILIGLRARLHQLLGIGNDQRNPPWALPVRHLHPVRIVKVPAPYGRPNLDALSQCLDHLAPPVDVEVVPFGREVYRLGPRAQQCFVLP